MSQQFANFDADDEVDPDTQKGVLVAATQWLLDELITSYQENNCEEEAAIARQAAKELEGEVWNEHTNTDEAKQFVRHLAANKIDIFERLGITTK